MKRFTLRLTTPLHTTLHLSQLLHLLTSQLSKLKKMFPFELSQNANIHHLQTNITSPTANSNIHHLPNTTNTTPLRCLVDGGHNIIHYPSFNSPWPNKSVPLTNQCFPSGHPPSTCKLISAIPHLHTQHYYFREPPPHSSDPILLSPIQPSPPLHLLSPFHRPSCCTWPLLQHNLHPVTRYRLRKKYPLPPTIAPSETNLYAIPLSTRSLLLQCFAADPYPCAEKKKYLSQVTDLTYTKINYWFKNMRVNRRRKMKAAC